ncbi:TetR family transcriptional regulator [Listeria floridensis FSL S10-1187]|uniref:TetR family transcriptional regulator n=1 Tax=Listeria floridensis FSL S10-1187 TaxID=1265817 RepID=A0ABN0RIF6_9LIST|nr:TetR/AcrR family transcriptional regulator [Listeria floridensis]EUJ33670.1 TetR family transcriptional regulator [Listeria floridensis FSL S10-1187]
MTDKRIQKTKRAFYQAFLELLDTKNVEQITVSDLVKQADVNRTTFYRHYREKEDLLNEMIADVLADLRRAYNEPYQAEAHFSVHQLQPDMIKIFDHVEKNQKFYHHVITSKIGPGFQNEVCNVIKKLTLRDALHFDHSADAPNLELLASYQSHAIFGMIVYWVETNFHDSKEYMAEQLFLILKLKRL